MQKIILLLILSLTSIIAFAKNYYPFVQTHTFSMEPYLPYSQGYAFFIASKDFKGNETVKVKSDNGVPFPDMQANERVLSQFDGVMWYIADSERIKSATSGELPDGNYTYSVASSDGIDEIHFAHKNSFLEPVSDIQIQENSDNFKIQWQAPSDANTFWVFLFPSDTKDILKNLKPMTTVMHTQKFAEIKKSKLVAGKYKIAIRANRIWEADSIAWALDSESWAISQSEFEVK